ncbi:hypothetical protein B0T20DRAFT_476473 [Sordaria brevicollis]|uniref:Cerato-platanin n=1 Tax=Sordaria brevicollis TaxID=83679 RepID=A0AAE0UFY3_SORBR|nr:hypothetical protein B0T20DRAFT_476473 [Sordaria brevicollis]
MMHKVIFLVVVFVAAFGFAQELSTSIIKAGASSLGVHSPVGTPDSHIHDKRQSSGSGTISDVTPHPYYSSSVGVLGCKINTNRVAYWKEPVDCDNICVKLTNVTAGRSVTLLRIDQSGGAHDISYDAWNYLFTGKPAAPGTAATGGAEGELKYEYLPADNCKSLITDGSGKLPLSAANSMNYLTSCTNGRDTWVGRNHQLWNINDPLCHRGYDEKCTLAQGANQATCGHGLGTGGDLPNPTDHVVMNIEYGTGKEVPVPKVAGEESSF